MSTSCGTDLQQELNFVLMHPGRRCVELGCGTGMVGVALCRIGAAAVQLTDGNAAAVHNCRHNLEINQCVMPEEQDCQLRKLASSQTQVFACAHLSVNRMVSLRQLSISSLPSLH